ncbi:hypothetical protein BCR44DRAFT_1262128 [Catenaria anguillulae PL171]|uniref:Uncharacterized protein n=1 Tax=Catenaria anguillulae PL171 TaxID=765915 RepID=A0A1Y2HF80_9FUNG|nr:hypothetical protein BCR44DRAFT_1262128 [Catenaria anguillulae PL171]
MMADLAAPLSSLEHAPDTNQAPAGYQGGRQEQHDATPQEAETRLLIAAVRIDSDRLVDVNASSCRHEFSGETWRLTYVKAKNGAYSLSVRVPVVVTASSDGPVDFDWKALLIEVKEPANRVDAAHITSIVNGCNWDDMLDKGLAFSGTKTHTRARELTLPLRFTVKIRKKYFLAIVVNDVGVAGGTSLVIAFLVLWWAY